MQKLFGLVQVNLEGGRRQSGAAKDERPEAGRGRRRRREMAGFTREEVASHLGRALAMEELELHYQPQVSLATGAVAGVEAFLRWRSPVMGLLSAREFLPIARDSGDLVPIERWVLRRACSQVRSWLEAGLPSGRLALNVSPVQVMHPEFLRSISLALYDFDLQPGCLELEITEPSRPKEATDVKQKLSELHRLGVRIALDRVGAVRSSLNFISETPSNTIKIGGSLVRAAERGRSAGQEGMEMLDLICLVARKMNKVVAAAGVETEGQRRMLVELGCIQGQGHLFARPRSASETEKLLRSLRKGPDHVKESLSESMIVCHP
jgi:EAL domain-containing protein (putative c-di-GMP-specific phosphodiesterase class I)